MLHAWVSQGSLADSYSIARTFHLANVKIGELKSPNRFKNEFPIKAQRLCGLTREEIVPRVLKCSHLIKGRWSRAHSWPVQPFSSLQNADPQVAANMQNVSFLSLPHEILSSFILSGILFYERLFRFFIRHVVLLKTLSLTFGASKIEGINFSKTLIPLVFGYT